MPLDRSTPYFVLAVLILLPGFYLYQLYVFAGFPPVFGGYLVYSAVAASVVLVFPYLQMAFREHLNRIDILYWILTFFYLAWAGYNVQYDYLGVATQLYASAFPGWICYYLLGRVCPFGNRTVNRLAMASLVFMTLVVLAYTNNGSFEIGVTQQTAGESAQNASYQAFALIFVVTVYVAALTLRNRLVEAGVLVVSAVVLFLIGSRSEAIFVALIALYFIATSRYRFVTGLAALLAAAPLLLFEQFLSLLTSNRFAVTVLRREGYVDTTREYINARAIDIIRDSPLFGEYGRYESGLYAHNITSAWVDFGAIGFLLYVLLLGFPLWLLASDYIKGDRDRSIVLVLSAVVGVTLLMITTKSIVYYMVPFAVGLAAHRHSLSLRFLGSVRTRVARPPRASAAA